MSDGEKKASGEKEVNRDQSPKKAAEQQERKKDDTKREKKDEKDADDQPSEKRSAKQGSSKANKDDSKPAERTAGGEKEDSSPPAPTKDDEKEEKKDEKKVAPKKVEKKISVTIKKSGAKIEVKKALKQGILTKIPFKDASDMNLHFTVTSDKGAYKFEIKNALVTYGVYKDEVKLSQLLKRQDEKREDWTAEMADPSTPDGKTRNWHFAITPLLNFLKEKLFEIKE